jgi:hypothetical protein
VSRHHLAVGLLPHVQGKYLEMVTTAILLLPLNYMLIIAYIIIATILIYRIYEALLRVSKVSVRAAQECHRPQYRPRKLSEIIADKLVPLARTIPLHVGSRNFIFYNVAISILSHG